MRSSSIRSASPAGHSDLPEFAEALSPIRERFRFSAEGRIPASLEDLEPAFHLGYEARRRFVRFAFSEIEPHLAAEWIATQRRSRLPWSVVRQAAFDAWQHRDELELRATRRSHSVDF